jgi:hypothetical protein
VFGLFKMVAHELNNIKSSSKSSRFFMADYFAIKIGNEDLADEQRTFSTSVRRNGSIIIYCS